MQVPRVTVAWTHPSGSGGSVSMTNAAVAHAAATVVAAEFPQARISVGGVVVREFVGVPA